MSMIFPRLDLAARVEQGLRLADELAVSFKPLFEEGNFASHDLMQANGLVAPNNASLLKANDLFHSKELGKLSALKLGDWAPPSLKEAIAALDNARIEVYVPKEVIKNPALATGTESALIYNALDQLERSVLRAHMDVTASDVVHALNDHAPIRKGAALVRVSAVGVVGTAAGVGAATLAGVDVRGKLGL